MSSRLFGAKQRGATLVVALLMLSLLTVHAVASFVAGGVQVRVAGSLQARQEAQAAANVAINRVLGSSTFVATPGAIASTPIDIDIDGDGRADYRVMLTATCQGIADLLAADLDPANPGDAVCAATGTGGAPPCATAHWNLQAIVTVAPGSARTGVTTEVNQGVAVRLDAGEARATCGLPSAMSLSINVPASPAHRAIGVEEFLAPSARTDPAPDLVAISNPRRKTYWYFR